MSKAYVMTRTPHWVEGWFELELDPATFGPDEGPEERAISMMFNGEHKPIGRVIGESIEALNDPAAGSVVALSTDAPPQASLLPRVLAYLERDLGDIRDGLGAKPADDEQAFADALADLVGELREYLG